MLRRTIAIAAALSVLALGSPLITGCTNPSATQYFNQGAEKYEAGNYQGAIADYTKAIEIDPQHANAYGNRGFSKGVGFQDSDGACSDFKKAASLGLEYRINWLNSDEGAWCRNM